MNINLNLLLPVLGLLVGMASCSGAGTGAGPGPGPGPDPDTGDPFDMTAMEFVSNIKLGLNLGNCFDAFGGSPGMTVDQLETLWSKNETTLANIQGIKAGGFNTIRIPITWAKALDTSGSTVKIRDDWMARITQVVDWALDEGLYVIINTHHDSTSAQLVDFIFPLTNADVNQGLATFRAIWSQIARNFESYPAELIFEGLNEPSQNGNWNGTQEYYNNLNKYYQAFVDEVRATGFNNAKRFLICNTYSGGGTNAQINGLTLPTDTVKNKLIVGFHSYNPSALCLTGTQTTWDGNVSIFKTSMDAVYNKFVSKGVPAIISEFGIMNKDNMDTRIAWTEAFVSAATQLKMPCIWWDDGVAYGDKDELLGFYDRDNNDFFFPELLDALKTGAGLTE